MLALAALALTLALGDTPEKATAPFLVKPWLESGPSKACLDVVFVGDGYTKADLGNAGKYWKDVQRYAKRFLEEPPFAWYRAKLNVRAAFVESKDSGCNPAPDAHKVDTLLKSSFDAPNGRLLVFKDHKKLAEIVGACGDVDIVLVVVNTERYGGGGSVLGDVLVRGRPLPAPTFAAQDTASFLIALHELGHSFGGLADEYEDVPLQSEFVLPEDGKDLGQANVTLPAFFDASSRAKLRASVKWGHFLDLPGGDKPKWLYEGGYFRSKGVFRPWQRCLMLDLASGAPYCPVCCEELSKAIAVACGESFDDAGYHRQHPLSVWK